MAGLTSGLHFLCAWQLFKANSDGSFYVMSGHISKPRNISQQLFTIQDQNKNRTSPYFMSCTATGPGYSPKSAATPNHNAEGHIENKWIFSLDIILTLIFQLYLVIKS